MNTIVRKATPSDSAAIASFQVAMAMETEKKTLDINIVETAVRAVFDDPAKGFYIVAEFNKEVVASLMITFEWSDWRNSTIWYIQSVFVTQERRKTGVFSRMYHFVLELAKDQDIRFIRLYVETENKIAQGVYQSLGMKRMPYYLYDVEV